MVGRSLSDLVAGKPPRGPWKEAAGEAFGGQGSCGNGAAMRIAPLGAYYTDDPKTLTAQAIKASEVTHQHPEGIAGGVAVAHAAASAAKARLTGTPPRDLLGSVLDQLGESLVRKGIQRARTLWVAAVARRTRRPP
jgi:ADP-ribosylglycohydrolase